MLGDTHPLDSWGDDRDVHGDHTEEDKKAANDVDALVHISGPPLRFCCGSAAVLRFSHGFPVLLRFCGSAQFSHSAVCLLLLSVADCVWGEAYFFDPD